MSSELPVIWLRAILQWQVVYLLAWVRVLEKELDRLRSPPD